MVGSIAYPQQDLLDKNISLEQSFLQSGYLLSFSLTLDIISIVSGALSLSKHADAIKAIGLAALTFALPPTFPATNETAVLPPATPSVTNVLSALAPPTNIVVVSNAPARTFSNTVETLKNTHSLPGKVRAMNEFVDQNFGPFAVIVKIIGTVAGFAGVLLGINAIARQVHPDEVKLRETPLSTERGVPGFVLYHVHSQTTSTTEVLLPRRGEGHILHPVITQSVSPRYVEFRFAQLIARLNNRFPILAFSKNSKFAVLGKMASWMSEPERRLPILDEAAQFHPKLSARIAMLDPGKVFPPISPTENILGRIGMVFEARTIRGGKEVTERVNHIEVTTYFKMLFTLMDLPFIFAATVNHERPEQRELVLQDLDRIVEFSLQSLRENSYQIFQGLDGYEKTQQRIRDVANILEPMLLLPRAQSILYMAAISLGLTLYKDPVELEGKTVVKLIAEAREHSTTETPARWSRTWLLKRTIDTIEELAQQAKLDLSQLPPFVAHGDFIKRCADSLNGIHSDAEHSKARQAIRATAHRWRSVCSLTLPINEFLRRWNAAPTRSERLIRTLNLDPRLKGEKLQVTGNLDVPGNLDWVMNSNACSDHIARTYTTARAMLNLPD